MKTNLHSLPLSILLTILFLGIGYSINPLRAQPPCHPDFDALMALYNSTDGANWTNNTGWVDGAAGTDCDVCGWYGVYCDGNGRVIQLDLNSNGLSGPLPAELGDLSFLFSVSMRDNQLSGSIPTEIGSLSNLVALLLDGNLLSGDLPASLGALPNLSSLYLSQNDLSGDISTFFDSQNNLYVLFLAGNQFTGSISTAFGSFPYLAYLDLGYNQLTGTIPASLGSASNLNLLNLQGNQLSGSIPPELGDLSSLTYLSLAVNQLSGCFPDNLSNLCGGPAVYMFDNPGLYLNGDFAAFCANGAGGCTPCHPDFDALMAIYTSTGGANWTNNTGWIDGAAGTDCDVCNWYGVGCDNGRVVALNLQVNNLAGPLPTEIGNLTMLNNLGMLGNQLSGSIPTSIGNLTNLESLELSENQLTGTIPASIGNLTNLSHIQLNDNQLSGAIPTEIGSLSSIGSLYFQQNLLSGDIPSTIGNLSNLIFLGLQNNQLTGSIPTEMGNLTQMVTLELNNNLLSGSIPAELSSLTDLEYLYLSNNDLSGCLPVELLNLCAQGVSGDISGNPNLDNEDWADFCATQAGVCGGSCHPDFHALMALYNSTDGANWVDNAGWADGAAGLDCDVCAWAWVTCDGNNRVSVLNLQYNNLTGPLPGAIGNLSQVHYLYLIGNNLSGSLPAGIGNLAQVEILYLDQNNLSGPIPASMGDLDNLLDLSLSVNQFSGPIPPSLGDMASIVQLKINENQLSGDIPPELGNLSTLQILGLSGNMLSGEIPAEIGNLANLGGLSLSSNQLTGSIPPEIGNLSNLLGLYLDNNNLSDNIPVSLGSLVNLYSLNLSGNQLSGSIPSVIGNISVLEELNLFGNQLTGPIPAELGSLSNLYDFNLSNNDLSGCLPPELLDLCANVITGDISNNPNLDNEDWADFCANQTGACGGPCHPDFDALIALYNSTDGANWSNNTGWIDGAAGTDCDVCNWYGVSCDGNGRVTQISLDNNQLSGSIPPALGDLSNLQFLNLIGNQLSGSIPPELGNLSALTTLYLFSNQLSGIIPLELGNLSNLIYLSLGLNQLSGEIPSALGNLTNVNTIDIQVNQLSGSIPVELGNLTNLYFLALGNNTLSGSIPTALTNLSNLGVLDLSLNQLTGGIPPGLGGLNNLQTLLLHDNQLTGTIPAELGSLSNLDYLTLNGNQLSGSIPPGLGNLSTLLEIYLNDNQLSGCIPSSFSVFCNNGTIVNLGGNAGLPGGGDFAAFCANGAGGCTPCHPDFDALMALYNSTDGANWNINTGWAEGAAGLDCDVCAWPGVVCDGNGRVTGLNGNSNNLTGPLPAEIGDLSQLQYLVLVGNNLSGSLPSTIGNLEQLILLYLNQNNLSGTIPASFGNLDNLVDLGLTSNQFSGAIPPSIGDMESIEQLIFANNQLSGDIPPELGNLTTLQVLVLSGNMLSGEIPAEIGNLANLGGLSLSNNQLTGSIPPEIGSLSNLLGLYLDNNNLSGDIPAFWSNFPNLSTLALHNNQLSGSIPASLGSLVNLVSLNLSGNQLSGSIPPEIGSFVALDELYLSANQLTGAIPAELGNLSNLIEFNLSNNDLSGCLPPELLDLCAHVATGDISNNPNLDNEDWADFCANQTGACVACTHPDFAALIALYNSTDGANWTNNTGWADGAAGTDCDVCSWHGVYCDGNGRVAQLYLYANNLVGTLPTEIGDLTSLYELDLSGNQLSGLLSTAISHLGGLNLTYLNLAENLFTGPIPVEIGAFTTLSSLTLASNPLSGSIPPEIGDLTNLGYLNLYDNQLTGSLPPELGSLTNLVSLGLFSNQISGCIPSSYAVFCSNGTNVNLVDNPGLPGGGDFAAFCANGAGADADADSYCAGTGPNDDCDDTNDAIHPGATEICNGLDDDCDGQTDEDFTEHPDYAALMALYNSTGGANWTNNTGWIDGAAGVSCEVCSWPGIFCNGNGRVDYIYLPNNNLVGTIPSEIGDLTYLKYLYLNQNQLSGSIPASIGDLSNLIIIQLYTNQLTGSIPQGIGGLSNLVFLNLSENQLTGTLPPELGNLPNLTLLYLYQNQLSGSIPTTIGNLSSLTSLVLYDNQLTGVIPAEIGSLSNLQSLYLQNNQLSGALPVDLGNLTNLTYLYLNNNQLTGCIPPSYSTFCNGSTIVGLSGNPGLPGGGDFSAFCTNGTGADADADGYCAGTGPNDDCDDTNDAIHPGATEICDGIDNDCDGLTDDADPGITGRPTWYADADGDGYGNAAVSQLACNQPVGYVSNDDDCNDNPVNGVDIHPGATEICNGVDDDCDGLTDDADPGITGQPTWYADADGDGYGNAAVSQLACNQPVGYVSNDDDCNDNPVNGGNIYPGATEICNGVDDDCDGLTDDDDPGITGRPIWYADADGDNYGDPNVSQAACIQPIGFVSNDDDCDDNPVTGVNIHPGATEICNGIDDNCDGMVDGLTQSCYTGPAGTNGVGPCVSGISVCTNGVWGACVGQVVPQTEICNGLDDNCNGQIDEGVQITFTATPTAESCAGALNGAIAITNVTGGTAPFLYSINNGVNYYGTPTFTGLATGTYAVRVKANNCESAAVMISVGVGSCPIEFSGTILWEHDDVSGVKDANVKLTGSATASDLTDINGDFLIAITQTSGSFTLKPVKNINKFNGVTVGDATAIQQHVIQAVPITDPYKLVCADVNKSNSITTLDAALILQALNGSPQANAIWNTSWRFVPSSHTMLTPPWGFPEQRTYTNISGPQTDQDFVGMKIGDVTAAYANPANLGAGEPFVLRAKDQTLNTGEILDIGFTADQLDDLAAFQFALTFDPAQLQFEAIEPAGGLPITADHFGTNNTGAGEIRAVWSQATGLRVEEAAPVFRLRFKALQSGAKLSDVLQLDEAVLSALAYTGKLAESKVELAFSEATGTNPAATASALQLQVRPNPFQEETTVAFTLPAAGEAQLRVLDLNGREILRINNTYPAGHHSEILRLGGLTAAGVLTCELITPFGVVTRKMVLTRL